MKKDLIFTMIVQIITLLSVFITFKLISLYFGAESFAEYSITRRNVSVSVILISIGMHIALTKLVSQYFFSLKKKINLLLAAFFAFLLMYFIFGIFLYFFIEEASFLIYADLKHMNLVKSLYIGIGGLLSHVLIYSYLRGVFFTKYANVINLLNQAIIPMSVIFISIDINDLFILIGFFQMILSLLFIFIIIYKHKELIQMNYLIFLGKKLFYYGFIRLPAEIGLLLFLMIFVIFINHEFNLIVGGYISFAITIVTTLAYLFSPLGIVIFPKLSKMLSEKLYSNMKVLIIKSLGFVFVGSSILVYLFFLLKEFLLYFFLPEITSYYVDIISYIVLGSSLYPLYLVSKYIIDACYTKGINSRNMFYASIFFFFLQMLVVILKIDSLYVYVLLFSIFVFSLSILSLFSIYQFLKKY